MAYLIGDQSLLNALVALPLVGAWTADVTVAPAQGETGAALAGSVTVELDGLSLTGTVVRSAPSDSRVSALIVGGAGGLSAELAPRYYKGSATVAKIAGDILREAGETLAAGSDPAVLATVVPTWQRAREPAGLALTRLLESVGAYWRTAPDGTILALAGETWAVVAPDHTKVPGSDPTRGARRYAWPETTPADLLPGTTFDDAQVRYVEHELTPAGLRTEVRDVTPQGFLSRLRTFSARGEWYSRLWAGVVDKQNADGTVDVVIAGAFGETQVPIRHGIPGVTVEVSQGQQILVGYEADDPKRPFAALWTTSGTAKIGTLILAQNASSLALLPPQWFAAGTVGDAAADAALVAITGAGNVGYKLAITMPIVEVV